MKYAKGVPIPQLHATCMAPIVIYLGVAKGAGCNFCRSAPSLAQLLKATQPFSLGVAVYLSSLITDSIVWRKYAFEARTAF